MDRFTAFAVDQFLRRRLLARNSHQIATNRMKNNLFLSIYADFAKVSPGQTALGARSLVRNAG